MLVLFFWTICSVLASSCIGVVMFFKQKRAYELGISDWSSDVCSSDLAVHAARDVLRHRIRAAVVDPHAGMLRFESEVVRVTRLDRLELGQHVETACVEKIGRASCRERVCQYV